MKVEIRINKKRRREGIRKKSFFFKQYYIIKSENKLSVNPVIFHKNSLLKFSSLNYAITPVNGVCVALYN